MSEANNIKCEPIGNMLTNTEKPPSTDITEKRGKIYKLTNRINGKVYVGQTIQTLPKRWSKYKNLKCHDQPKLLRALVKYGWDAFTKEIIEECLQSELNCREVKWIKHFDSVNTGYNLTCGGDVPIHSKETLAKMSKSQTLLWKGNTILRKKASDHSVHYWQDPASHIKQATLAAKLWKDPTYRARQILVRTGKKNTLDQIEEKRKRMVGVNPKLSDYTDEEIKIIKSIHGRQTYTEEEKSALKSLYQAAKTRMGRGG